MPDAVRMSRLLIADRDRPCPLKTIPICSHFVLMRIERPDSVEIARWMKLSELPGCWLEIDCCRKSPISTPSLKLLRKRVEGQFEIRDGVYVSDGRSGPN
jgi:hypothetical protein